MPAAQTEFPGKRISSPARYLASHEAASQKRMQQSKAEYLSMKSRLDAAAAQLLILGVDARSSADIKVFSLIWK